MDDKKRNNVFTLLIMLIVILIGVIIWLVISNNKNNKEEFEKLEINSGVKEKQENSSEDNSEEVTIDNESDSNNIYEEEDDNKEDNINIDNNDNVVENNSEEDVINYFEDDESEINNSTSFKEKFKEYFISIIDFIFYDKEIKGYKFKDLSNDAKLKIISIALKVDNKLEDIKPGYKESITDTSSRVYTNAKEKLTELFLDIASNVCKNRDDECNKAKDMFSDIKDTCKIGWSFIKKLISSGGSKLKEWYEVYSGK